MTMALALSRRAELTALALSPHPTPYQGLRLPEAGAAVPMSARRQRVGGGKTTGPAANLGSARGPARSARVAPANDVPTRSISSPAPGSAALRSGREVMQSARPMTSSRPSARGMGTNLSGSGSEVKLEGSFMSTAMSARPHTSSGSGRYLLHFIYLTIHVYGSAISIPCWPSCPDAPPGTT